MHHQPSASPDMHAYVGAITALSNLWNQASAQVQVAFDSSAPTNPGMYRHIEQCAYIAQAAARLYVPAGCADIHAALITSMQTTIESYAAVMAGDAQQAALVREAAEQASILGAALVRLRERLGVAE